MRKFLGIFLTFTMALTLVACGESDSESEVKSFISEDDEAAAEAKDYEESVTTLEYKNKDYYFDYTEEEYVTVDFSGSSATISGEGAALDEDGNLSVTEKGIYVLSGDFTGTVKVDVDSEDKVYLVLNNVNITSVSGPAIYGINTDKLVIMLPEGTVNTLEDSAEYPEYEDKAPNACLFCQDDLSISGTGSLSVKGNYKDGIGTKDDLRITGGNITVEGADDGIVGHDSLGIADGNITVSCKDDAIHTEDKLVIDGGTINVTESYEGIEGYVVVFNGGDVNVVSSDDGVNSAGGNDGSGFMGFFSRGGKEDSSSDSTDEDMEYSADEPIIYFNGGNVTINAEGDGFDSNGAVEMNGGYVLVYGPTNDGNNATDYQSTFTMNGGLCIGIGTSGMYQSISEGSACYAIDYISNSYIDAGVTVSLYDGDTLITSFETVKKCNAILITGDSLENEKEYTLKIGDTETSVTAGEGSSEGGFGGMGGGNFGGGKRGFGGNNNSDNDERMTMPDGSSVPEMPDGMEAPDGEMPEMPDGMEAPDGEMPEMPDGMTPPDGSSMGDGTTPPTKPGSNGSDSTSSPSNT